MEQQDEIEKELMATIAIQENKIQLLEKENSELRDKIQKLLHERYGKKSEKVPEETLPVIDEPVVTEQEAAEIQKTEEEITVASYTRGKPKRKPIPKEYPRETIIHDLTEEQKICSCGCNLHCSGEETTEKLDYIPAKIKVIVHIRKKYACRGCGDGVKIAPGSCDLIPKSLAAPGLLSHVILSKYEDHLPLYRQEKIWQRLGIDLARSTLCNWALLLANSLKILADLQKEELLALNYVRADETPVQVMEENQVRTSKKAYMWVFVSGRRDKAIIIYQFAMSRAGSVAEGFFGDFKGFIQADGFSGYNKLFSKERATRVGCMSHARRKFATIVKTVKKTGAAHYAMAIIAKLYFIEKEIKEKNLSFEATKENRQKYAKPILDKFKDWLIEKKDKVPDKSELGKAVFYFIEHWESLVIYLEHGFLDIDNNFTEQRIRPFSIGRKNWLFMGNERGGEAAAVFFGLIESAKANGLNTYAYFRYIITQLPLIDPKDKELLKNLLPHRLDPNILEKYFI